MKKFFSLPFLMLLGVWGLNLFSHADTPVRDNQQNSNMGSLKSFTPNISQVWGPTPITGPTTLIIPTPICTWVYFNTVAYIQNGVSFGGNPAMGAGIINVWQVDANGNTLLVNLINPQNSGAINTLQLSDSAINHVNYSKYEYVIQTLVPTVTVTATPVMWISGVAKNNLNQ